MNMKYIQGSYSNKKRLKDVIRQRKHSSVKLLVLNVTHVTFQTKSRELKVNQRDTSLDSRVWCQVRERETIRRKRGEGEDSLSPLPRPLAVFPVHISFTVPTPRTG